MVADVARFAKTVEISGFLLNSNDVLVGESGGLSAIYRVEAVLATDAEYPGSIALETEHGLLIVNPSNNYTVLDQ